MSIRHAKIRGRVKLRGRPENQARAEIMVMKAQEKYEERRRRRRLFTLLDFIIIIAFSLAIYSFYSGYILNGILLLIVGIIPLVYFVLRRVLKNNKKSINKKKI
jgi:accessory gene regulator protein AgrB